MFIWPIRASPHLLNDTEFKVPSRYFVAGFFFSFPQYDRLSKHCGIKLFTVMTVDIYLDVLVVINTYITWLLVSLTVALTHTYSKALPRAAASFIGGLSALIILIPQGDKLLCFTSAALKIISCIAIVVTAFWRQSVKKYFVLTLSFLGINMLLSAALELLQRALKTHPIALSSGFIYLDISPVNLIVSTAAIYLSVCFVSKLFSKRLGKLNAYRVDFKLGCKAFSLDGVADTGNTAKDLFSGLPVIICTGVSLESSGFIRAVPYKTISGEGVLYALNPESITVTDEKGIVRKVTALVAGVPGTGEQRAIFNPQILM